MPSFDGGDDLARVFCPDKWLWVGIGIGDEAVDCVREFLERTKHAALKAALGQEREQTFDSIEPGCRGRGEVEDKARVASEPSCCKRFASSRSCPTIAVRRRWTALARSGYLIRDLANPCQPTTTRSRFENLDILQSLAWAQRINFRASPKNSHCSARDS